MEKSCQLLCVPRSLISYPFTGGQLQQEEKPLWIKTQMGGLRHWGGSSWMTQCLDNGCLGKQTSENTNKTKSETKSITLGGEASQVLWWEHKAGSKNSFWTYWARRNRKSTGSKSFQITPEGGALDQWNLENCITSCPHPFPHPNQEPFPKVPGKSTSFKHRQQQQNIQNY